MLLISSKVLVAKTSCTQSDTRSGTQNMHCRAQVTVGLVPSCSKRLRWGRMLWASGVRGMGIAWFHLLDGATAQSERGATRAADEISSCLRCGDALCFCVCTRIEQKLCAAHMNTNASRVPHVPCVSFARLFPCEHIITCELWLTGHASKYTRVSRI